MITNQESPEKRLAVRITPELADKLQRIANERYEGNLAMVAREAFRRLVANERDGDADPEASAA